MFTTADRKGDGGPESMRYVWNGTAGQPLTRQVNGGPLETITQSVADFSLTYDSQLDVAAGVQRVRAIEVSLFAPVGTPSQSQSLLTLLNRPALP